MFRVISYPLTEDGPVWPQNPPPVRLEPYERIADGDMANTTALHLFSHSGTHLDAPWHFNPAGLPAVDLPIESYVFQRPLVADVPRPRGGFIGQDALRPLHNDLVGADLVLLRTGWSAVREIDPGKYGLGGPVLHPDAAAYLMDNCPRLKGIGVDAISIGSPAFIDETMAAHRILTGVGRTDGRFALIFEDMRVDVDLGNARRIYAWPLMIVGSDSSPCTMVAEFTDE